MNYLHAIILSIVEGFTEFLPISSTGHLVLTAKLLNIPQTEFVKSFEIIIQLGAILAVIFLYWKTIWTNKKAWKPIIFAFIPTAVVGLTVYKILKSYLLGNETITLYALLIGGIIMIAVEYRQKRDFDTRHPVLLISVAHPGSQIPDTARAILRQTQDKSEK